MASLSVGSSGPTVMRLQRALADEGYLEVDTDMDGKFGPQTQAAVMEFQKANGLTADGKVGPKTAAALELDGFDDGVTVAPVDPNDGFMGGSIGKVERGSKGEDARQVQQALKAKGYDVGTIDGSFGSKSVDALMKFQAARGLTADGKVGPKTAAALGLSYNGSVGPIGGGGGGSSKHIVAHFNSYKSGRGMVSGTITLNGRTYAFNSGNGKAFSSPKGEYVVRRQGGFSDSRGGRAYNRNGVGFSFVMEGNRGSDRMWDARAGRNRGALRIHPDGGSAGTLGCLGLTGSAAELRQFRSDLNAAIRANGGSIRMTVS